MLSVRGEFGYWVFEGDWQPAQRPSWNYKKAEGGGIILDMMCHWRYVLDNLFGEVESVSCLGATHIPKRWDENGKTVHERRRRRGLCDRSSSRAAVIAQINMSWATRVRRDDLVTFHVDGTHGSAVAGLQNCWSAGAGQHAAAGVESGRAADDELLRAVAGGAGHSASTTTASRSSGSMFIRHVVEDAPFKWTLLEGAKGVQLVEAALQELEGAALDRRAGAEGLRS